MEYINSLDKSIDNVLENNIFYSILLVGLILYCTFSPTTTINTSLTFDNTLVKLLLILCILYFGTKDIRISLLLLIIFLIELDKINNEDIKVNIVTLLVKDASFEQRLNNLENLRK